MDAKAVSTLTFQQEFYRYVHQGGDGLNRLDAAYAFRLRGALDVDALRRTFEALVLRHESLRMRVVLADAQGGQYLGEAQDCGLQILSVPSEHGTSAGAAITRARQLVEGFANQVYELTGEPLSTARLLELPGREYVLYWSVHHLISDHVTRRLLLRELWLLYAEIVEGRPSSLEMLPVQFAGYQAWQLDTYRAWLQKHRPYWSDRLAGAVGIQWPSSRCESRTGHREVATAALAFPVPSSVGLRDLARKLNTLLSLEVLAVYVSVLSRWCNQHDFVVATTASGRDSAAHLQLAGYLAHPMYLRITLTGHETPVDVSRLVTREYFQSLFRKDFGGMVQEIPELLAGTLFQWFPHLGEPILSYAKAVAPRHGLEIGPFPFEQPVCFPEQYNIMFVMGDGRDGVFGTVVYRTDVFAGETVERFIGELLATAQRFVETPDARLATDVDHPPPWGKASASIL